MARSIHLRFAGLPSGLASYPRVLLTRRKPLDQIGEPPEIHARVAGVRLQAEAIRPYAIACGFAVDGPVPVTYPHVLAMPLHLKIFSTEAFPLKPMGLIHLANRIETPGKLVVGSIYDVDVAARNFRRTDAGLAFDMDSRLSAHGRAAWRETSVFLARWPDAGERAGTRPQRPPKAPRDSRVLAEVDVTLGTAWSYARVSQDFNPIHLHDRAARMFGLRSAIVHGMWSLARSLASGPAIASSSGVAIDAQFLTPVQLPAQVAIREWEEAGELRRAMCDARSGRVHMHAQWSRVDTGRARAAH